MCFVPINSVILLTFYVLKLWIVCRAAVVFERQQVLNAVKIPVPFCTTALKKYERRCVKG